MYTALNHGINTLPINQMADKFKAKSNLVLCNLGSYRGTRSKRRAYPESPIHFDSAVYSQPSVVDAKTHA